ncbi:hypothetical protein MHYP_G00126660 [Metynnis hypsauchen]
MALALCCIAGMSYTALHKSNTAANRGSAEELAPPMCDITRHIRTGWLAGCSALSAAEALPPAGGFRQ